MARARHSRELPVAHKLCQAATSARAICHLCMYLVAYKLCHIYMGPVPPLHGPCATSACIRFRTSCAKSATSAWAMGHLCGPSRTQIVPHMISTLFTWHRLWLSQVRMCCKNIYYRVTFLTGPAQKSSKDGTGPTL